MTKKQEHAKHYQQRPKYQLFHIYVKYLKKHIFIRFEMKKSKSIICYRNFVSLFLVYISFDIHIENRTKKDSQRLLG